MAREDENGEGLLPGEDPEKRRRKQERTREKGGRRNQGNSEEGRPRSSSKGRTTVSSSSSHRRESDQPRTPRRSTDISISKERRPPREIRAKRRSSSSSNPPPSSSDQGDVSRHTQSHRSKPRPSRDSQPIRKTRKPPSTEMTKNRLSKQSFVGATSVPGIPQKGHDDEAEYDDNVRIAIANEVDVDYSMAGSNKPVYQATAVDPSMKPRATEITKRNSMRKYGVIGLLLSGAIALIVVIVVQQTKKGGATPSSLVPTLAPTFQRETCIADRIQNALLSDLFVLDDPTSPQSKARDWIIFNDTLGSLDCTASNLIQRWALATFYFATTKDNAKWQGCAPTEDPVDTDCVGYTFADSLLIPINERTYIQDQMDEKQWLKHADECIWYGVICNDGATNVETLHLYANKLKGTIPKEIGVLTYLRLINLIGNALTGTIPTEIGLLSNKFLSLEVNTNQITGTIPEELYNMKEIEFIDLEYNEMSGTISTRIGELTNIRDLVLGDNIFEGTIPPEIGNNIETVNLLLYENNFSGSIPPEIGNLKKLERFFADKNALSGSIPTTVNNLSRLVFFRADSNKLVGTIPDELYEMQSIDYLILNSNQFSGQISSLIGNMKKLKFLYLAINDFTGRIPTELGNCISLREMRIELNRFTGPVPTEVCNLSFLGLKLAAADCAEEGAVSSGLGFNQCDCCTVCCNRLQPEPLCIEKKGR
uniref:Leucine-rich repeat-containing N-terminal plant-type domain-containing protein n=1 Tax=Attheya septentrionalis TaxID=420275 RepID=A0A7S2UE40_9STRA|mmetsp:Transcript_20088/g.36461  ORF Transcript_20088/g.36461 Transcript_20088/m.36461 type:complete len:708 (+) Transcript_20088:91-2214(+)